MKVPFFSTGIWLVRIWAWLTRFARPLLRVVSFLYGGAMRFRRTAFDRGWVSAQRLPKPVISVGNMTLGGTGKTPFVIWLARALRAQGKTVAILSRGYGRENPSQHQLVSDVGSRKRPWKIVGDEPWLISQHCPQAVVAVGSDRYQLGRWVLDQVDCDCFILDDGFQHLPLYRNLDFVLFDATDVQGIQAVFPEGRLREPLSFANKADAMVFTRSGQVSSVRSLLHFIQQQVGREIHPIFVEYVPRQVVHVVSGDVVAVNSIRNKSILLVSGIGNPQSFQECVKTIGGEVVGEIIFPDHCHYGKSEIQILDDHLKRSDADMVLTTEKDAVKLLEHFSASDPIWAVHIQAEITQGEERIRTLLKDLFV